MIDGIRSLFGDRRDDPPTLSTAGVDDIIITLSNERRRHAIHILSEREEGVELSELARGVYAHTDGVDPGEVTGSEFKSVYITLYQNHVPQMEAAGVVESDRDSTVRPGDDFEAAVWLLQQARELRGG